SLGHKQPYVTSTGLIYLAGTVASARYFGGYDERYGEAGSGGVRRRFSTFRQNLWRGPAAADTDMLPGRSVLSPRHDSTRQFRRTGNADRDRHRLQGAGWSLPGD